LWVPGNSFHAQDLPIQIDVDSATYMRYSGQHNAPEQAWNGKEARFKESAEDHF
jgi:hypothetical protein